MSFSPLKTSALVWAATTGPQWLARRLAPLAVGRASDRLTTLDPAVVARRFTVRRERRTPNDPLPFATLLKLPPPKGPPEPAPEVYLLGASPGDPPSQVARLIEAVQPEVLVLVDGELRTVVDPFISMPPIPLSHDRLVLLDWRQVGAKADRQPEAVDAATVALRAARATGIPVALVGPPSPLELPPELLRSVVQRALLLPPRLVPYDPVAGVVLTGDRSVTVAQRLRDAAKTFRRVVGVVPLPDLPLVHALWTAGLQAPRIDYAAVASAPLPTERPNNTTMARLLSAGAAPSGGLGRVAHAAAAAALERLTTRAVRQWLQPPAPNASQPAMPPTVRRRLLPNRYAVLEWNEQPEGDAFYGEVEALHRVAAAGPDTFEPALVLQAWHNIAPVFANSMLLARGATPLEAPLLRSWLVEA